MDETLKYMVELPKFTIPDIEQMPFIGTCELSQLLPGSQLTNECHIFSHIEEGAVVLHGKFKYCNILDYHSSLNYIPLSIRVHLNGNDLLKIKINLKTPMVSGRIPIECNPENVPDWHIKKVYCDLICTFDDNPNGKIIGFDTITFKMFIAHFNEWKASIIRKNMLKKELGIN